MKDHFLVHSLAVKIMPRKQSSIAIAIHTPLSPIVGARRSVSDTRTIQMLPKFISDGMSVLPAPTNTDIATMAAANPGSAHASILRISVPKLITDLSGEMSDIISGANSHIINPMNAIMPTPSAIHIHAKECIRSRLLAPLLCPTSVVAASATPCPGI